MIGTTLSHYQIEAELGRGGMGIVYKAQDTKLDRTVAIKVLPSATLASEDDRERFYREAKAAAQLHHPNIASVFEIDEAVPSDAPHGTQPSPFIAMEYIAGGTLQDTIKDAPMKLSDAVNIASQVAEALKAAHAKDIVHRDIKSANVMLTEDGVAKVLDFGLAKTNQSTMLTRMGSTLGTVAYMSPEQARGQEVDGRTDLYSLGTMLYELVSGRVPFGGEYEQAVVYSILNEAPEPLTSVRTGVPMELERITNKLLSKEAEYRYQTAADLLADFKSLDLSGSGQSRRSMPAMSAAAMSAAELAAAPAADQRSSTMKIGLLAVGGVLLLLVGTFMGGAFGGESTEPPVEKLMLEMEGMRHLSSIGISPGGRYLALTGYDWVGRSGLFLFDSESGSISYIDRSDGAHYPWFSPSGDRLAFSSDEDMLVVDVPSGTPTIVVNSSWTSYWMDEEHILYTLGRSDFEDNRGSNQILTLATGASELVNGTEEAGEGSQWYFPGPRVPGSNLALGNIQGMTAFGLDPKLYFINLDDASLIQTSIPGINAQPISDEILIYQLGDDAGKLVARRFDARSRSFSSSPVDVSDGMFFAHFQADPSSQSLVYVPDNLPNEPRITVYDLTDGTLNTYDIAGEDAETSNIALSEDGNTLLGTAQSGETGLSRLITIDLESESQVIRARNVSEIGVGLLPGGKMMVSHYELRDGGVIPGRKLVLKSLRSSEADTLTGSSRLTFNSMSGNRLLVTNSEGIGWINIDDDSFELLTTGTLPHLSPDGRYMAFNRVGGVMAVMDLVSGESIELTGISGYSPRWAADGQSLFYIDNSDIPAGRTEEADIRELPVAFDGGVHVSGEPIFHLHIWHPQSMTMEGNRVAIYSRGPVSTSRPIERSARVGWWRNYGRELEESLPR